MITPAPNSLDFLYQMEFSVGTGGRTREFESRLIRKYAQIVQVKYF
jgi:hypothetical protein